MTPPIHLTLLALAELAPAARWWVEECDAVIERRACDWADVADGKNYVLSSHAHIYRHRVTCSECLVMLDWALEQEP